MTRKYTYLIFTDFVYVRLKGLVWIYNGLTNPNNLDKSAGDALAEICSAIELGKPLLIDCKGISGITDHAWDILFQKIESTKREIIFINFQKIEQKINLSKREFCTSLKMQNSDNVFIIYKDSIHSKIDETIEKQIEEHLTGMVELFVKNSFWPYSEGKINHLSSTPISSNGEFDAASLISNPESFYWTCLLLADKVEKIIQKYWIGGMSLPTKLLTVSLRSSPFAASIGLLLGLQVETVDHFGPILKNHETDNSISNTHEYIYIGDFSVGGTEIKISKTYALMRNSKLEHAIVIASLFDKSVFKEFNLHPLVYLIKACPTAKYSLENIHN